MPTRARRAGLRTGLILAAGLCCLTACQTFQRAYFANGLFSGTDEVDNFRSLGTLFPVHGIARPAHPDPLPAGAPLELPAGFTFNDLAESTEDFLSSTDTTGLLVLQDGRIVYERYWRGNDAHTHWISWSVAKSFVSALVGIAVHDGAIGSIEDPVTRYLPELAGSAYDGVRIKDILQMSSGASWNEDYGDRDSDINRFGRTFALGGSFDEFVRTLKREHPPGTFHRYNSMDTQVLGMLLRRTTGRTLADDLHEKLWVPLGMESDAWWLTDDHGAEFAAGGLNATLRDYARLGLLYANGGLWRGVPVVPAEWVKASVTPDAPHLMPGRRASAQDSWGYGYQWWVPDNSGNFSAVGIYNQFVYVSPAAHLVIAKTSANHAYGTTSNDLSYRENEHIAFFRAIEASLGRGPATAYPAAPPPPRAAAAP
jgi:CubicO group peptidase (beta-lactamase class C family)